MNASASSTTIRRNISDPFIFSLAIAVIVYPKIEFLKLKTKFTWMVGLFHWWVNKKLIN